jgi:hypothetical protein
MPDHNDPTTKKFADEYHEQAEKISLSQITTTTLRNPIDFTYKTYNGTKTVRSISAHSSLNFSDELFVFYDNDTKYGFNVESKTLYTVDRSRETPIRKIASPDNILTVEQISFPTRAPVVGAIQTDVPATIYYRSPRSDQMQSIEIKVSHNENDILFEGESTQNGDWIRALCIHERTIRKEHPQRHLGRVTRVEFPRGQSFTVNIEGISDDNIAEIEDRLESTIDGTYPIPDDATISVSHSEQLYWE